MANYFSGSDNQKDPSTMHYLKEQLPSSYTETSLIPGSMMMYMNSYADTLAGNSQHSDITPVGEPDSTSSQQQILSSLGGTPIGLHDFSPWRSGDGGGGGGGGVLHGTQILQGQGLSLSLGTQVSPGFQMYRNPSSGGFSALLSGLPSSQLISGEGSGRDRAFTDHDESVSKYPSHGTRALSNSKYLKAAQQLLDEVVNVRVGLKERNSKKESGKDRMDGTSKDGSDPQDSSSNNHELSSAEKQDLQNKLSKLSSMLDEVDSRYKQYYHQMQIVTSSFDLVAGPMAAKPYTALALQTISRHFRCLRDAINVQIMVTRKSLGEHDDSSNSKGPGISRLRYVDQQLRQQKALQHLGMMQQHAWRPQRGLPENAVSILRAWLFEHFLHPYPKDSDKIMLARQTGLTRGQVSNWFINARVRLWKPMVEEMYKEETGEAEVGPTSSSAEMAPKSDTKGSEDRVENTQQSETSTAMEQCFNGQFLNDHQRANNNIDDSHVFPGSHSGYHMSELERFGNVSGVSLTLGLQHCDGGTHHPMSSLGGDHQSFVANVYHPEPSTDLTDTSDFDCLDSGNRQHRFGSSHMLHDFVA